MKLVPLAKMRVSGSAQRALKVARVEYLLGKFDLEMLGNPVVNRRDGSWWIIDGQHRIEALKRFFSDWETQSIECRCYDGLTEREEAVKFRALNDQLVVATYDQFRIGVRAGESEPVLITRILRDTGLKASRTGAEGGVRPVGTLAKVLKRSDAETLAKTLRITYNAFGTVGLSAAMIDGVGHVCQRYSSVLSEEVATERLGALKGGVGAIATRASVLRKQTGRSTSHCVAAVVVDVINYGRGGKKLPSWWNTAA